MFYMYTNTLKLHKTAKIKFSSLQKTLLTFNIHHSK